MNTNQTRSDIDSSKQKINGWKWAFITLVLLLVGSIIYITSLLRPISTNQIKTEEVIETRDKVSLTTSLSKSDAELIINEYLEEAIGEDFEGYNIVLSDDLEIHGNITILNFDVPFKLFFSPYALENGNIQLRGKTVELANFSLPVSGVMSLLTRQLDLPEYILVNSNTQIIEIDLVSLMQNNSFDIAVDQIDLEQDIIQFNLGFNKNILTNQEDEEVND